MELENHFKLLFTTKGPRNWGGILDCVLVLVSPQMNINLVQPFSEEEIQLAGHQLGSSKAPGPKGFFGLFYQHYWSTIHAIIYSASAEFFHLESMLAQINKTQLVLIPKVLNPETVGHFRPISLCNFAYKILSKVLSNRLKKILPTLVSPFQNAFVGHQQIQDNVFIAHEAFHRIKLRKKKGSLMQWGLN